MTVSNCIFDLIYSRAIDSDYVINLTSTFNSYRDVGNEYGGTGSAVSPIIYFDTNSVGCSSIADQFDRTKEESYTESPCVFGNTSTVMLASGRELRIGLWEQAAGQVYTLDSAQTNQPVGAAYLINDNSYNKKVQYSINRGTETRSGILMITYNVNSGYFNLDDDSSETGDVGITFSLQNDGTNINLYYTSSAGLPAILTLAESYLDLGW
jgi:hypothetical protein